MLPTIAQAQGMDDIPPLAHIAARWRIVKAVGDVCPLCYSGYVFRGGIQPPRHPDMAAFCYHCQRRIEDLCAMVASGLTIMYGQAVDTFDVLTRFFGDVAPFSPMAQLYGRPY